MRSHIITGAWSVGQKIPSESDLAASFGVNRLTVRMAIQKLTTVGVLQTRPGEGTFVKEFSFMEYMSEVSDFILKPSMMSDMFEFRKLIENECIRLAIIHYDEKEIDKLQELYEVCAQTVNRNKINDMKGNLDEYISTDLAYHYQIYKMSKNEVYYAMMCMMRDLMIRYQKSEYSAKWSIIHRESMFNPDGTLIAEKDPHLRILNAIRGKNYEAAKEAFIDMVADAKADDK